MKTIFSSLFNFSWHHLLKEWPGFVLNNFEMRRKNNFEDETKSLPFLCVLTRLLWQFKQTVENNAEAPVR